MPFIPHTEADVSRMLEAIGVSSIDDLFDEIPASLRAGDLGKIPPGMTEMEVAALMATRARADGEATVFIGAGAYDHHVHAAVWEVTTRGEFYSAYTPYQAEASQGTLQLLYEFQSMMTALMDMDVSNASLYDGASALAEAALMAVRANRKSKSKRILMPATVHPAYRRTVRTICRNQGIELVELPFDPKGGHTPLEVIEPHAGEDFAALVIPQPNFFGVLEDVDALTDWAAANQCLSIAVVNPLAMAALKPPGQWGEAGADISCGEGQPLGAPLSSGGPYFGFLCARQAHVRQMPGRIIDTNAQRIDSTHTRVDWQFDGDYFLMRDYEMWAESRTFNTVPSAATGLFFIIGLAQKLMLSINPRVMNKKNIRIISVRRSRDEEVKIYES